MNNILHRKWALALVLGAGASNVAAQTYVNNACTTSSATACYEWKQDADRRVYEIHYDVVAACDDEIITAANAWENAGSKFSVYQGPGYPTEPYNYAALRPGYQIYWEPGASMASPVYNAETRRGWAMGGTWRRPDGVYIPLVNDADIFINMDRYAQNLIECTAAAPTSTQRDMARTIAHEFGHVVGMDHLTSTACLLYEQAQPGVAYSAPCSIETGGARTLYGVR